MGQGRVVKQPAIASNADGDNKEAVFNSIGYYSSLLERLDKDITTCEDVFTRSFTIVRE